MSKLLNIIGMTRQERCLFFGGVFLMPLVRIGLLFCSTRRIGSLLEAANRRFPARPAERRLEVRRAARRLTQAAQFCPVPLTCLAEALAGRALLARYGLSSELRIGVRRSDSMIEAHAWLECPGDVLIGNPMPKGKQYVPLSGAERLMG